MNRTAIENIIEENLTANEKVSQVLNINRNDLLEIIFDFDLENDFRLQALTLYNTHFREDIIEVTNKISTMFLLSGTTLLREFLTLVCIKSKLDGIIKIECAKSMCAKASFSDNLEFQKDSYLILNTVIKNLEEDIYDRENTPTPCRVEAIIFLMKSSDFKLESESHFNKIINDTFIDCVFRYKTIVSLEFNLENQEFIDYFMKSALYVFLEHERNWTMYRILAAQCLLQKYGETEREIPQRYLHQFMIDNELAFDLRADAADVLLNLGDNDYREQAREVILFLGRNGQVQRTIFDNRQNIHAKAIEDSAVEILESLQNRVKIDSEQTIDIIRKELIEIVEDKTFKDVKSDVVIKKYERKIKIIGDLVCDKKKEDETEEDFNRRKEPYDKRNKDAMIIVNMFNREPPAHSEIKMGYGFPVYYGEKTGIVMCTCRDDQIIVDFDGKLEIIKAKTWEKNNHNFVGSTPRISGVDDVTVEYSQIPVITIYADNIDKLVISFNRLLLDRALYSKFNLSLHRILLLVWNYILSHEHADELKDRLIEELLEMSGKCATGYAYRLVNVLSGFGDYSIRISWEDEIGSNLSALLNRRIQELEDEEYMENILVEMSLQTDLQISSRHNFMKFFRNSLPSIKEELFEKFTDHISDADFDLYMRKAVARYEGHEFI